ncbi:uncharacterized protein METZ01_LOCUS109030 [marine metagenome]|uniref:Uncharacterized protein n=1 Tax=marine metagenome TaxID=408172 RepID=A0A381WUI7_9ZZZZ
MRVHLRGRRPAQHSLIIPIKSVGCPVVDLQHVSDGAHEDIHTGRHDGHEDPPRLQRADRFARPGHQRDARVTAHDILSVDLGLYRSPQTDVVSHELIIADLAIQEALKGFEILGTEAVVDILP